MKSSDTGSVVQWVSWFHPALWMEFILMAASLPYQSEMNNTIPDFTTTCPTIQQVGVCFLTFLAKAPSCMLIVSLLHQSSLGRTVYWLLRPTWFLLSNRIGGYSPKPQRGAVGAWECLNRTVPNRLHRCLPREIVNSMSTTLLNLCILFPQCSAWYLTSRYIHKCSLTWIPSCPSRWASRA